MGMLDGRPFVPKTGAPIFFKRRRYVLRWTREYGRAMFSIPWGYPFDIAHATPLPTYRLEPKNCIDCGGAQGSSYHYDIFSVRTGKQLEHERITCYMVRVNENKPIPKRPWWHDGRTPFRRNDPWHF